MIFEEHSYLRLFINLSLPMKRRPVTAVKMKSEGRGEGRGSLYKPGLRIQDVSSHGLSTRIQGWKTQREHHFLSKLELSYFFLLEWSPLVLDVREQYPLDLEETIAIAESLGIRHPTNPYTKHPAVLTTDFLITISKAMDLEEKARTVKPSNKLSSKRVMEKFEIERIYWKTRDVDWGIVTEKDINQVVASNVEWVHPYKNHKDLSPLKESMIHRIRDVLLPQILKENAPLRKLTDACDVDLDLASGSSLMVVRHLIANKQLDVNMSTPIQVPNQLKLAPRREQHKLKGSDR
jgi:hypothetical protein